MAGVRCQDLSEAFGGRAVARIMPTTAVAGGFGVASVFAINEASRAAARAVMAPIATLIDLSVEDEVDVATALSGSGAAYVYALTLAMSRAGQAMGLGPVQAEALARATVASAARWMAEAGTDPEGLIAQVASPGGTTEAALKVLAHPSGGLDALVETAMLASLTRARDLSGPAD